jgi:hypothetical protein
MWMTSLILPCFTSTLVMFILFVFCLFSILILFVFVQDEKVVELQDNVRRLERALDDEERKVEDLTKKIRTDETG